MTVCLSMIVRDEAAVIRRCLQSVRPLIDRWAICDTGSTDGTQDIIRTEMRGVPGKLVEFPWVDFAHNRNQALDLARRSGEKYLLTIDAKDELVYPQGWKLRNIDLDAIEIDAHFNDLRYRRTTFFKSKCRWAGAVHEYVSGYDTIGYVPDVHLQIHPCEGYRGHDPLTLFKDLALLQKNLTDPRDAFYYAQTLRDMGMKERAMAAYRKRAEMPGWEEESWFAQYQAARLAESLGGSGAGIAENYLAAWERRPWRAEPLVDLGEFYRLHGRFHSGYLAGRQAVEILFPENDRLFVDASYCRWRAFDSFALCCYETGRYDEAVRYGAMALDGNPADGRLAENMKWYQSKEKVHG